MSTLKRTMNLYTTYLQRRNQRYVCNSHHGHSINRRKVMMDKSPKQKGTIGNSSIQESEGYSHEHSNLTVEKPSELNTLLTIVIPTFNEQEAIGKVLDELFSIGLKNILVVDGYDGFLMELDNINSVFIGISALMLSLQSLLMTSAGDVIRRKQMYIG